MPFELPDLPYAKNALEPYISSRTLEFHHGMHHNAYVTAVNKLIEGTDLKGASLEDIVRKTAGDSGRTTIFNNAAQAWNHAFYWKSMRPQGGGPPEGPAAELIKKDFGGQEKFAEELRSAGAGQFGSGWAWLVLKDGRCQVMKTANADTPIARGIKPLLTVDVWEHAYYLDYQNRRPDYLKDFVEHLLNWDFVNANLGLK